MSNAIATPKQLYTLKYPRTEIEKVIRYVCDELPTYKFLAKNDTLNSIRVEARGAFLSQHLDFRFQPSDNESCVFELEVSKSTGGMTNDDRDRKSTRLNSSHSSVSRMPSSA